MAVIKSKHDQLIEQFIHDDRYIIYGNGQITRKGKLIGYVKKTEKKLRGKQYRYVKYQGVELKIHRIIYRRYVGKLDSDTVVHHIDADSLNNDYRNLELITQELNNFATHY